MRVTFTRAAQAPVPGTSGYTVELRAGAPFVYEVDDTDAAALIAAGVAVDATGEPFPTIPIVGEPPDDLFIPPPPPPEQGDGL
jgi:hypothetical protein